MTTTNVVMLGAKQLERALQQAQLDLLDLRETHLQAAKIVMNYAKPRTPRDTGALANSLRVSASRTTGIIEAGNVTDVPYARIIHYGNEYIRAQPWLSHAAQFTEPTWIKLYEERIDEILETCETRPAL